jgi:hypothetical protein
MYIGMVQVEMARCCCSLMFPILKNFLARRKPVGPVACASLSFLNYTWNDKDLSSDRTPLWIA